MQIVVNVSVLWFGWLLQLVMMWCHHAANRTPTSTN